MNLNEFIFTYYYYYYYYYYYLSLNIYTRAHALSQKPGIIPRILIFNNLKIWLVGWLVGCNLWHINLCRLFNAKSIVMQIVSSISKNSV